MAKDFVLPSIGDTMVEAELVEWFVAVGDAVAVDQPICSLETDKSLVEMTSPFAGTIVALGGEPGNSIRLGDLLIRVAEENEVAQHADAPAPAEVSTAAAEPTPEPASTGSSVILSPIVRRLAADHGLAPESLVGTGVGGRVTRRDVEATAREARAGTRPVRAMLKVKRAAETAGIDLGSIAGSGPGGAVTSRDLVATPKSEALGMGPAPTRGERRERMSKLRRTIAANLTRAVQEIPTFTAMVDADMTNLLDLRSRHAATGAAPLPIDALLAACLIPVLGEFPVMNARVDGDDIVYFEHIDLGVAVDTPDGLMVPVIRDVRGLDVHRLASEIRRLADAGRERALPTSALVGATITLNNTGSVGLVRGTPILPLGSTAIVSAGRSQPTVRLRGGTAIEVPMLPISCTFDHRAIDGGHAGQFLGRLVAIIEQPALLTFG